MNFSACTFTPVSATAINLDGITQIQLDPGGSVAKFGGDVDHGPSTVVNDYVDYTVTITMADISLLNTLTPGLRGVLTWTHQDAKGAVGGSIIYTLADAMIVNNPSGGQFRQYGMGTVQVTAEWAGGSTNPLSVTAS
jgi:hypothetical protein